MLESERKRRRSLSYINSPGSSIGRSVENFINKTRKQTQRQFSSFKAANDKLNQHGYRQQFKKSLALPEVEDAKFFNVDKNWDFQRNKLMSSSHVIPESATIT